MEGNYEELQRNIYENSLEIARRMGDPDKTKDIFRIQRLLLSNRLIPVQGEPIFPDSEKYHLSAKRLENKYATKFEELEAKQRELT